MKRKIGIDLDGVLRDFANAIGEAFVAEYPHLAHKITLQTDYSLSNLPFSEVNVDPWKFIEQHSKEIFGLAKPVPGAIEATEEIVRALTPLGHQIVIVSHQLPSVGRFSWLWLYLNDVPVADVVFVQSPQDKWDHVDIMIDDSPHVLAAKPEGKFAFKVNQTYNKDVSADWSISHVREFLPIFKKNF